jgi:hypothetical protein
VTCDTTLHLDTQDLLSTISPSTVLTFILLTLLIMNSHASRGATSPAPTPKFARESKEWSEGDFEVITADGVRYLVPSYLLFYAR